MAAERTDTTLAKYACKSEVQTARLLTANVVFLEFRFEDGIEHLVLPTTVATAKLVMLHRYLGSCDATNA